MLVFVLKILGYIITSNLIILPILWILKILYLFTLILIYEGVFTAFIGILQILGSYIYKENRYPPQYALTKWFDFRKFAKLKPKERQRYRQEGKIMMVIGLILCVATIIIQFSQITC